MDIYVHLYGNLSHYMNSSDIFTKTEINPFENVIMHVRMHVRAHTQKMLNLQNVNQVAGGRGRMKNSRLRTVIPDSNYIYTLIVHL